MHGAACAEPLLHAGSPPPPDATKGRRAYKASYNRPFATRAYRAVNMPFNSELPAVRWLERNGFDVSYWSGVDADRYAFRLASRAGTRHRLYLSVGHDEYWSGAQRAAVTAEKPCRAPAAHPTAPRPPRRPAAGRRPWRRTC